LLTPFALIGWKLSGTLLMTEPDVAGLALRRNIDQVVVLSRVIPRNISKRSLKLLSACHDLGRL
jgi:hypothetical protein